jgi:hypothetical protein
MVFVYGPRVVYGGQSGSATPPVVRRTLTMAVSGSGTTSPAPGTHSFADGQVVTLTASPSAGARFDRWQGAVTGTSPSATVSMTSDKSVTAVFVAATTATQRILTMVAATGGTTTPAAGSRSYADGAVVAITATPAAGYRFERWQGMVASPTSATTTVTMNADQTVAPVFAATTGTTMRTLTISRMPAAGGTTTPAAGSHAFRHGATVTITATPAPGYRFVGWQGIVANPASATTQVLMSGNRSVTANFAVAGRAGGIPDGRLR